MQLNTRIEEHDGHLYRTHELHEDEMEKAAKVGVDLPILYFIRSLKI